MTQGISATITAAHSQSDELRPIRIGAVAQQPAPDLATDVYIGLALLLPADLRALCSCVGLFYAQILSEQDEEVEIRVAALPRYFDANLETYKWHVREITISYSQLDQLLEYDRCLAAIATCDLRNLVVEHAAQARRQMCVCVQADAVETEASVSIEALNAKAELSVAPADREDADLAPLPTVFVPRSVVQEVFRRLGITQLRERRVHTAMLVAALDSIELQLDRGGTWQQCHVLKQQYDQIRDVQSWRRQRRDRGYDWQRVIALEEAGDHGRPGWDVIIGTPIAA